MKCANADIPVKKLLWSLCGFHKFQSWDLNQLQFPYQQNKYVTHTQRGKSDVNTNLNIQYNQQHEDVNAAMSS